MSSYMMWFNANRNDIKEKNPDAAFLDISKIGGDLWRALEATEKAVSKCSQKGKKLIWFTFTMYLHTFLIFFILVSLLHSINQPPWIQRCQQP